MKYVDYLFWSYYCFCNRHPKIFIRDNVWEAIFMMVTTVGMPVCVSYALVDNFVVDLPDLPEERLFRLLLVAIAFLPLCLILGHRYRRNKKITNNNFQLFKDRWGEDPRKNKKGRIAVIVYTFLTTIFALVAPMIILYIIYKL